MNPTEEFEIYQFLCKEAEAYVPLSQLLKDAHLTMEAASSAVADFRKQFQKQNYTDHNHHDDTSPYSLRCIGSCGND